MAPFLIAEGLMEAGDAGARAKLLRAAPLIRERIKVLADAVPLLAFLFGEVGIAEGARELLQGDDNVNILKETGKRLLELETFDAAAIEGALRAMAEEMGTKPRKAFQPIRVAVAGSKVSPPLFESMELLGREKCMQRIARALEARS